MDLADQGMKPIDRQVERADGSKAWIVAMGNREIHRGKKRGGIIHRMYVMAKTRERAVRTARLNNYHKTVRIPLYVKPCSYRDLGAQESNHEQTDTSSKDQG